MPTQLVGTWQRAVAPPRTASSSSSNGGGSGGGSSGGSSRGRNVSSAHSSQPLEYHDFLTGADGMRTNSIILTKFMFLHRDCDRATALER